jgi:uncharacterized protein (TIGR02231 family)
MNKLLSPVLLWLVAAGCPALALTADQKVTAVTVYPDRALVTRSGEVKLEAGVQSVVFESLPVNLEEDSVRAKASSEGKLKILGVEVRRDYKEVAPSPATKQLQDDLAKLDDQIRALTDEQNDLRRRDQFLDDIRDKVTSQGSANGGKDETGTVQNITGLFQLYGTEMGKITTRQREIDFTLRELNRQKNDKTNQLSLLQQPAAPNTRSAIVTVDSAEAGMASLSVSYLIAGAEWQPQYDAYADPDTQKVELTYYGVVRQTTGEDWSDVALTLSSARPSTAARLPELAAWTVDLGNVIAFGGGNLSMDQQRMKMAYADKRLVMQQAQQALANASAQQEAGKDDGVQDQAMAMNAAVAASPPVPQEAAMETAEVRSLGPAATFVVPARTSIPSDNQPHRSAISVQTLQGEWTYEATPKLVPSAFLKTKVTNTSGGPLLGGEINAFLGNNFIGKSSIGLVAANATFDLFLGADENIKVTRTEGVKKDLVADQALQAELHHRAGEFQVDAGDLQSARPAPGLEERPSQRCREPG